MDYALLVVDGRHGIGNGHVIPAGPMRAPLSTSCASPTALAEDGRRRAADGVVRLASRAGKPVFEAALKPRQAGALRRAPLPRLRRHRPSRQVLRHGRPGRRHGRRWSGRFPTITSIRRRARRPGRDGAHAPSSTASPPPRMPRGCGMRTLPRDLADRLSVLEDRRRVRQPHGGRAHHRRDARRLAAPAPFAREGSARSSRRRQRCRWPGGSNSDSRFSEAAALR